MKRAGAALDAAADPSAAAAAAAAAAEGRWSTELDSDGKAAEGRWWRTGCAAAPPLELDSEGKARSMRLLSCAAPHMRCFHLSWIYHSVAVFATFAAAPLLPVIRDSLDLTKAQVSAAGIAAVTGTIVSRIAMGGACDQWGPRYSAAALQLLTASASFGMAAVDSAAGYIAMRCLIGFSLASFTASQFWCSVMFGPRIVGTANALSAGWGNSAGGFVQLLMPLILQGMERVQPEFIAWRTCYLVVGWMQVAVGVSALLLGQDLPLGNYRALRRHGALPAPNSARAYWAAARNYRTWAVFALYGFSFGVELTMNNVFAQYIYDTFDTSLTAAGAVASVFGLCNLVTRPTGGWLSDRAARRFGMPGRLWVLFGLQASSAAFCCGLSRMGGSLGGTLGMAVAMALCCTAAAGATFGIVPFITRRGLGAANGLVGSGSSVGSIALQALFFTGSSIDYAQGFLLMGLTSLAASFIAFLVYFPPWGGMLPAPRCGACCAPATEEEYYAHDYTAAERERGLHRAILAWACEARSQRGTGSMARAAAAANGSGNGIAHGDGGGTGACQSASAPPSGPSTGPLKEQQEVECI